jgi:hypothetical protein
VRTWTRASDGAVFYPYVFSKTLPHDNATGLARASEVATLLDAVQCPSRPSIEAIAQSAASVRKLEGINGGDLFLSMGGEQLSHRMPYHYFHLIDSLEHAFEMAEVYAMQLLRDVPFADYEHDPTVARVIAELNKFPFTTTAPTIDGRITTKTLLRGGALGTTFGPHVSQLLFHPFCARARSPRARRAGARRREQHVRNRVRRPYAPSRSRAPAALAVLRATRARRVRDAPRRAALPRRARRRQCAHARRLARRAERGDAGRQYRPARPRDRLRLQPARAREQRMGRGSSRAPGAPGGARAPRPLNTRTTRARRGNSRCTTTRSSTRTTTPR